MAATLPTPPMPAPRQARLILAGGLAASSALLALWLIYWLVFHQMSLRYQVVWTGAPPESSAAPALLFQDRDAAALDKNGAHPAPDGSVVGQVRGFLRAGGRNPAVVYLSAPGFRAAKDAEHAGDAFVAAPGLLAAALPESEPEAGQGERLADLIEAFRSTPERPLGKRLLILDVGRVAVDHDLGIFGDDVVAEVKRLVPGPPGPDRPWSEQRTWRNEWGGFAVFCANAPGQRALASDADGRSLFGHFLTEALGRGRDARKITNTEQLCTWVASSVARWADSHGGRIQTPILLGDPSVRIDLPVGLAVREAPPTEKNDEIEEEARRDFVKNALGPAYLRERDHDERGAFMVAPIAWREFRAALLQAERFYRAGRMEEAQGAISRAEQAERRMALLHDGVVGVSAASLAVERRSTPLAKAEPLRKAEAALASWGQAPRKAGEKEGDAAPAAEVEDLWRFAEARLLDWADRFDKLIAEAQGEGQPAESFVRRRAAAIGDATRLRLLAERAATALQPHPWVDRLVKAGDDRRREVEDALFLDDPPPTTRAAAAEAEKLYQAALAVADAATLACRAACDLPFVGAWYVRRQALAQQDADPQVFRTVARAAADLNAVLDDGAADRKGGDPMGGVDALRARAQALRDAFDAFAANFRNAAAGLAETSNWQALDNVLAAPGLDPELRLKLVERSVTLAANARMKARTPAALAQADSQIRATAKKALNNEINGRSIVQEGLAATAPDDQAGYWDPGAPPTAKVDPMYERLARGMGLLEWCMLSIGGAADADRLARIMDVAAPGPSARPLEPLGPLVRTERARILRALEVRGPGGLGHPANPAASRAWLSLPASLCRTRGATFAREAADLRRGDLFVRLARRSLDDLELAEAGDRLRLVPPIAAETDDYLDVERRRVALGRPWELRRLNGQAPVVLEQERKTSEVVAFHVVSPAETPPGSAALLVVGGNPEKVALTPDDKDSVAWVAEPLPIGATASADADARLRIKRGPAANDVEDVPFRLRPRAFFRGRVLDGPTIPVQVARVVREFNVRLASTRLSQHAQAKQNRRTIQDQFVKHPGQCYIYDGADTEVDAYVMYRAVPGSPSRRKAGVRISLDGRPVGAANGADAKAPLLDFVDDRKEQKVNAEPIHVASADVRRDAAGSLLLVEILGEDGKTPIADHRVKVHVVDQTKYYAVEARNVGGRFVVTIRRLHGDPISREMTVRADLLRPGLAWDLIVHSNPRVTEDMVAKQDFNAPLLQGESVEYSCQLPPAGPEAAQPPEIEYRAYLGGRGADRGDPLPSPPAPKPPAPNANP